jgi:hypothetical protein
MISIFVEVDRLRITDKGKIQILYISSQNVVFDQSSLIHT